MSNLNYVLIFILLGGFDFNESLRILKAYGLFNFIIYFLIDYFLIFLPLFYFQLMLGKGFVYNLEKFYKNISSKLNIIYYFFIIFSILFISMKLYYFTNNIKIFTILLIKQDLLKNNTLIFDYVSFILWELIFILFLFLTYKNKILSLVKFVLIIIILSFIFILTFTYYMFPQKILLYKINSFLDFGYNLFSFKNIILKCLQSGTGIIIFYSNLNNFEYNLKNSMLKISFYYIFYILIVTIILYNDNFSHIKNFTLLIIYYITILLFDTFFGLIYINYIKNNTNYFFIIGSFTIINVILCLRQVEIIKTIEDNIFIIFFNIISLINIILFAWTFRLKEYEFYFVRNSKNKISNKLSLYIQLISPIFIFYNLYINLFNYFKDFKNKIKTLDYIISFSLIILFFLVFIVYFIFKKDEKEKVVKTINFHPSESYLMDNFLNQENKSINKENSIKETKNIELVN